MPAVMQQLVAPLAAEIARLGDVTRTQAEEIGLLRERVRVADAERQQANGQAAHLAEEQQQALRLAAVEARARRRRRPVDAGRDPRRCPCPPRPA